MSSIRIALVAALALTSAVADASPVTITGGFTGYDGPLFACGTQFSTVNGVNYAPNDATCDATRAALVHIEFPGIVDRVDFTNTAGSVQSPGATFEPNALTFTPAPTQEVSGKDVRFWLGTITYTNGIWPGDVTQPPALFHFTLTTHSADSLLDNSLYIDAMRIRSVFNRPQNTPAQNADFLYLYDHPELGGVYAYERGDAPPGFSNTVTFDLFGAIDDLYPTDFANVGGGFLADVPQPVPEPTTLVLCGAGLLTALRSRRNTRR